MSASDDPGLLPELAWLPIGKLSIDPIYQRTLDTPKSQKLIARIAEKFSWAAFGCVSAAHSGPDAWRLIDGQHRVEAVRRRGGMPHVPAIVLDLNQIAQAAAFIAANDRIPIGANALFYARAAAGDPEAMTIQRICDSLSIKVTKYAVGNMYAPVNTTTAIGVLYRLLKQDGEPTLKRALKLLNTAFRDQRGGLAPHLIGGVCAFAKTQLDAQVVDALKAAGIEKLNRAASYGKGVGGRAQAVVHLLQQEARREWTPATTAGIDRARLMAGR